MAESDLIRGNVDTVILKVLYEGDRYGYDLIKQINARGDGQWEIKQPTVYACLKRLEKQGFVSSYWDSSDSDGGRRKYYSLTDSGREVFLKYKSEFERATALFGGIISGEDSALLQSDDDYSDVEDESYATPKRKPRPRPTKKPDDRMQDPLANGARAEQPAVPSQSIEQSPEQHTQPAKQMPPLMLFDLQTPDKPTTAQQKTEPEQPLFTKPEPAKYARATVDPSRIIEQLFAAERGESYSDAQRKNVYSTAPSTTPQKTATSAPSVAPLAQQPSPRPQPQLDAHAAQPIAALPQSAQAAIPLPQGRPVQAPPVTVPPQSHVPAAHSSPIGFSVEDESPARREYKTVLEELVDRFAVAPPDVRSHGAAGAEQAATGATATTVEPSADPTDSGQFGKVKRAVRELGNDVSIKMHRDTGREFTAKNYFYSNRLLMTQFLIMCSAMLAVGTAMFCTFYFALGMRMTYDYLLYMSAGLLPILMFITAVLLYASNPDKTKRISFNFKFTVSIRFVIMLQIAVIIYCIHLIWGMPLGFSAYFIPSLTIPMAYALFIPVGEIIFIALLRSGKYAYND